MNSTRYLRNAFIVERSSLFFSCGWIAQKSNAGERISAALRHRLFRRGRVTPHRQPEQLVRWDVLGSVAYLGLLGSTVSYLLWNYAIHRLGSVRATTYIYLEPLVTMAVAAAMLGDSITWIALLGAVLIIGGLFLTKLKQAGA